MTRPFRIVLNGEPIATYELTREAAQMLQPVGCPSPTCEHHRPPLPDDWNPDVLSIAHLVGVQARARTMGIEGQIVYRMKGEAVMAVEAALVAAKRPDGTVGMTFRMVPVVVDNSVPWVDFEVTTP